MKLFKQFYPKNGANDSAAMAEMVLKVIHDGVIITDKNGVVEFINPAAASMTGYSVENATGLDYGLVLKLESKEGRELSEAENPLIQAIKTNQPLDSFQCNLVVGQSNNRVPVSISVLPVEESGQDRVITFRDITKELEEEGEQTEFISTASHEMRTPVATIDGYISLAINPQTATIDERARGYLTAAHAASQHLGKLFRDLLDVTKLDDGHIKPQFVPVEMTELVEQISNDHLQRAKEAKIDLKFGSSEPQVFGGNRRIQQVVYGFVDLNFMREILDNLIDNAIKYTPKGGSIYVNVRGDGDRVLINVTDTGMGISPDNLPHIFQKFYRVDNSDTRTIGGTGLGLYLVKQRTEAMGGRVWAESAFGEGSTFYVSLPRLSNSEYEKRMIVVRNQKIQEEIRSPQSANTASAVTPIAPAVPKTPTPSTPAFSPKVSAAPATLTPVPTTVAPAPVNSTSTTPTLSSNASTTSTPTSPSLPNAPITPPPAVPPTKPVIPPIPPQPIPQIQTSSRPQVKQINNKLNGEVK